MCGDMAAAAMLAMARATTACERWLGSMRAPLVLSDISLSLSLSLSFVFDFWHMAFLGHACFPACYIQRTGPEDGHVAA